MSPRGDSSLQASANLTSDGPVSVLAGTHYVAARPATLEFRETAIDAPAYAAAGSASLSVAGTLYIRHQDGLVVAGEPGAGLPGNRAAGSPYGQAILPLARCAARQRPSVTPAASASARWTCATPAPN